MWQNTVLTLFASELSWTFVVYFKSDWILLLHIVPFFDTAECFTSALLTKQAAIYCKMAISLLLALNKQP